MYKANGIYLADAYSAIKEIPDKSIDLVYTDIPYEYEADGGGGAFGSKKRDYHAEYVKVCENTETQDKGIDYGILDEIVRVCKAIYVYIWCSKAQIPPIIDYFVGKHKCRFEILTWHKSNPIPTCNGKYLSDTEYCLMFRAEGTKIAGTIETKSKWYVSAINKTDKERFIHPTIKPLAFVQNHLINSLPVGGTVLDPFAGSGTTLVAAKNIGGKYIGFEINPQYYEIAKKRLKNEQANGQITMFTM